MLTVQVWSNARQVGRVRCLQVQCREPKTGQQKVQLPSKTKHFAHMGVIIYAPHPPIFKKFCFNKYDPSLSLVLLLVCDPFIPYCIPTPQLAGGSFVSVLLCCAAGVAGVPAGAVPGVPVGLYRCACRPGLGNRGRPSLFCSLKNYNTVW